MTLTDKAAGATLSVFRRPLAAAKRRLMVWGVIGVSEPLSGASVLFQPVWSLGTPL